MTDGPEDKNGEKKPQGIHVSEAEQGMKLLRFLERHTNRPPSMLHKWIRTGQVRVNGKRSKPFTLLSSGDDIRLPPFAGTANAGPEEPEPPVGGGVADPLSNLGADLPVLCAENDILALNKPSGMAVQPGSGLSDSVADRLQKAFSKKSYTPAPAHRLDRHTSGVLLCGLTHTAQRALHGWFAGENAVRKEYLVWVAGEWREGNSEMLLRDRLQKGADERAKELVQVVQEGGQRAVAYAKLLETAAPGLMNLPEKASLLRVRLITGRTHQIRVQLASRGYPVIGDPKYGGPEFFPMLLHAWRITLPDGPVISSLPSWPGVFSLTGRPAFMNGNLSFP